MKLIFLLIISRGAGMICLFFEIDGRVAAIDPSSASFIDGLIWDVCLEITQRISIIATCA
jgi:hypothetical protein